jgi:hypothetical protein
MFQEISTNFKNCLFYHIGRKFTNFPLESFLRAIGTLRICNSGPEIGKNLDNLITFFPMHIFSNPIQDKGKIT